ncbi:MAG: hypothetical protein LBE78_09900, partial [Burkholderiaceae bacterium]|nr:hypothetical protein [Burkholderiaceae bacterium]
AALELMLADPGIQQVIQDFGGPLLPFRTEDNDVQRGIVKRYGSDLAARLQQLDVAQGEVQRQFVDVLGDASLTPGPDQPGSVQNAVWDAVAGGWTDENRIPAAVRAIAQARASAAGTTDAYNYYPRSIVETDGKPGTWFFDPLAFTEAWSQGDSPLQKAFNTLYGGQALQAEVEYDTNRAHLTLAGRQLSIQGNPQLAGGVNGLISNVNNSLVGSHPASVGQGTKHVDPNHTPSGLGDKDAVWFDPQVGWTTYQDNTGQSFLDKAFPVIFGTAMGFLSGGLASGIGTAITGATEGAAFSAVAGAVSGTIGSAATQMAANGKINFGDTLLAALSSGLSAGVLDSPMLNDALGIKLGDTGGTFGEIIGRTFARAGAQGVIQELVGGKFKDGALQGGLGALANEVSASINTQIDELVKDPLNRAGLSVADASGLKLLSRAAGSAIRALGNPDDPAATFASDFLSSFISMDSNTAPAEPSADPPGEFIAQNQEAWDQRAADQQIAQTAGGVNGVDDADNSIAAPGADGNVSIQDTGAAESADPLGEFIAQNQEAWDQRHENYQQFVDAFNQAAGDPVFEGVDVAGPGDWLGFFRKTGASQTLKDATQQLYDGLSDVRAALSGGGQDPESTAQLMASSLERIDNIRTSLQNNPELAQEVINRGLTFDQDNQTLGTLGAFNDPATVQRIAAAVLQAGGTGHATGQDIASQVQRINSAYDGLGPEFWSDVPVDASIVNAAPGVYLNALMDARTHVDTTMSYLATMNDQQFAQLQSYVATAINAGGMSGYQDNARLAAGWMGLQSTPAAVGRVSAGLSIAELGLRNVAGSLAESMGQLAIGEGALANSTLGKILYPSGVRPLYVVPPGGVGEKGIGTAEELGIPKFLSPRQELHISPVSDGRSVLTSDPVTLLQGLQDGSFTILRQPKSGQVIVNFGKPIGEYWSNGVKVGETQFGSVLFGKNGAHIIPANPKQW